MLWRKIEPVVRFRFIWDIDIDIIHGRCHILYLLKNPIEFFLLILLLICSQRRNVASNPNWKSDWLQIISTISWAACDHPIWMHALTTSWGEVSSRSSLRGNKKARQYMHIPWFHTAYNKFSKSLFSMKKIPISKKLAFCTQNKTPVLPGSNIILHPLFRFPESICIILCAKKIVSYFVSVDHCKRKHQVFVADADRLKTLQHHPCH